MNTLRLRLVLVVCVLAPILAEAGEKNALVVVQRVAEQLRTHLQNGSDYGYFQDLITTHFDKSGLVKKTEKKTYRTIWLQDRPFRELISLDSRSLSATEQAKESKRKSEFVHASASSQKSEGMMQELRSIEWGDIHKRYNFELLTPTNGAHYLLSFKPKSEKLPQKSRLEKVLNQLSGKVWIDENFNVLQAEASLLSPVQFGLGLAKVVQATVKYHQQKVEQVWIPAFVDVRLKVQVAFFKTEDRGIEGRFYAPYKRETPDRYLAAGTSTASGSVTQ